MPEAGQGRSGRGHLSWSCVLFRGFLISKIGTQGLEACQKTAGGSGTKVWKISAAFSVCISHQPCTQRWGGVNVTDVYIYFFYLFLMHPELILMSFALILHKLPSIRNFLSDSGLLSLVSRSWFTLISHIYCQTSRSYMTRLLITSRTYWTLMTPGALLDQLRVSFWLFPEPDGGL